MTPPLPTSRALLTSLLTAISAIPLLPHPRTHHHQPQPGHAPAPAHDNPLRRVPPTHRHLITTLHVLFPGLVLPALDLLERGFVERVVLFELSGDGGQRGGDGMGKGSVGRGEGRVDDDGRGGGGVEVEVEGNGEEGCCAGAGGVGGMGGEEAGEEGKGEGNGVKKGGDDGQRDDESGCAFYFVASAAAAAEKQHMRERRRRRRKGTGDGDDRDGTTAVGGHAEGYVVRLAAWSCSCAAFAFAAVQGDAPGAAIWDREGVQGGWLKAAAGGEESETEMDWSFGGMSFDGLAAREGVPVCKHLLACVLAERWNVALGRYVVERRVGREEMAGIVADT